LSFTVEVMTKDSVKRLRDLPSPGQPVEPFVDLFDTIARTQYPGVVTLPNQTLPTVPLNELLPRNSMFRPGSPLEGNPNLPRDATGNPILPRVFDTWSWRTDGQYDYSNWNVWPVSSLTPPTGVSASLLPQCVPLRLRILALKIT